LRIAMVSEHASPLVAYDDAGGQNVHVAALAAELARQGARVTVYTRRHDATTPRRVRMYPDVLVDHVEAGPSAKLPKDSLVPYMRQFATGLSEAWQAERPDIVHAHYWMSGWAALAAAQPSGFLWCKPFIRWESSSGVTLGRETQARQSAFVRSGSSSNVQIW
jgi:D-inositol-3-phosphate glycosyltransferase